MFFKKTALATIILLVLASAQVNAQNLDSSNYRILDPTTDSGGGASESSNYATIISVGNPTA
ncbi:MAG TPA: hypothetical protein VI387_03830, partial [Candidatus Brocadiales bacterium]|nr:hypothetical protein [Candidatus Brocadiales bacterium]